MYDVCVLRLISISGTKENVDLAMEVIQGCLYSDQKIVDQGELGTTIHNDQGEKSSPIANTISIPKDEVYKIVGWKDSIINYIRRSTECRITIIPNPDSSKMKYEIVIILKYAINAFTIIALSF